MQESFQIPCLCAVLRRASRAVTRAYEARLEPLGVTVAQHTILRTLLHAGPLAQHALADLLVMDSTTLTRTLSPLKSRGWIKQQDTDDRRVRRWALTRSGQNTVDRCTEAWQASQRDFAARLGETEWNTLRKSLHRLGDLAVA
ncbi:MAG: MarR family winged helix-turn-helix transcriptional regulator [Phycisphaerales bacterium]|nr:MarR family winged helix-turn-helix transcriptional regulator [Phycisphaerales bacterium]